MKPHILWFVADDLRTQLGTYGATETLSPNIDALAADSTLFERAYCQVPTCGASRASMLTGMYASETRFINFNTMAEQDAPDVKDMPTALRDAGYTTISNGKIYHSSADNVHSWDEVCGHDGGSIAGYACDYRTRPGSMCCVWPHGMSSGRSSTQNLSSAKGHTKCPDDATCQEHDWENELDFGRTEKFVKWMEAIEQAKLAKEPDASSKCFGCGWPAWSGVDADDHGFFTRGLPDGKMTRKVIEDLRTAKAKGTPHFITCGFVRPHLPFAAPYSYWGMYNRDDLPIATNPWNAEGATARALHYRELGVYNLGTVPVSEVSTGESMPEYKPAPQGPDGPALYSSEWNGAAVPPKPNLARDVVSRSLVHGYYAATSYVDGLVGLVLDELKALDMYRETVILFNSDHGYHLGEHGTFCKHSLYELALRVPLIVKAPGFSASRVPALVENLDIFPTLLDLAGIPALPHLQGKSLVPLLRSPDAFHKEAVYARYRDGDTVRFRSSALSEYCQGNCWSADSCTKSCAQQREQDSMFYDHAVDPDENLNRFSTTGSYAALISNMSAALARHRATRMLNE